jgi:hypothetical protein
VGTFVRSGKYRRDGGEWRLIDWETALPSRLSVTLPSDVERSLDKARRAYQRFGEYHDTIQQIRARLQQEGLEEAKLRDYCRQIGMPLDFEIAHLCWKPDYDPYFYQQLKKLSRNVYFLREEFIFQLPRAMVVEVPQVGHATYLFDLPHDVREFVRKYAMVSRDDIRKNRGNVAHDLGSIGRIMHGNDPRRWLHDLRAHAGESVDSRTIMP